MALIFLIYNGPSMGQEVTQHAPLDTYTAYNFKHQAPEEANSHIRSALNSVISVEFENEPLEKALRDIVDKADLRITYSKDITLVDHEKLVTLKTEEATVLGALYAVLDDTGLALKVNNRGLLIAYRYDGELEEADTSTPEETQAANVGTIAGRVTDSQTGETLHGAHVYITELDRGVSTDASGRYRIRRVQPGSYTVVFSYMGFKDKETEIEVQEGETTRRNVLLEDDYIEGLDIVISAQQRGQSRAFSRQRDASNLTNVISSEQMERFADEHMASAIRRIPGVSFTYDRGEPGSIYIRGVDPRLTGVQVDGHRMASTDARGRETEIAGLSTDMISSVEVHKTFLPDQDTDGIGGIINLETRRPTDERFFRADFAGGYNSTVDGIENYRGSITYGQRFGRVGFMVNATASEFNSISHDHRQRWMLKEFDGVPTIVPERVQPMIYRLDRERYGISSELDYLTPGGDRFYVQFMHNEYYDKTDQSWIQHRFDRDSNIWHDEENVEGGRIRRRDRRDDQNRELTNAAVGGEFYIGFAKVDAALTYAYGNYNEPFRDALRFEMEPMPDHLRINVTEEQIVDYELVTDDYWTNPEAYEFDYHYHRPSEAVEENIGPKVDVEIPIEFIGRREGSIKFGGMYNHKYKNRRTERNRWDEYIGDEPFSMADMAKPTDDVNTIGDYEFPFDYRMDWDHWDSWFPENEHLFNFDEERAEERKLREHDSYENLIAGYGMATVHFGDLEVLGGLRVEHVWGTYEGYSEEVDEDGEYLGVEPVDHDRTGDVDLFPALHLRYNFERFTNLRFAITRTIARPNFSNLIPRVSIDRDRDIPRISTGNPNLKPMKSLNVDLSVEHFFMDIGVLSGNLFFKDMQDFVYRAEWIQEGGEFDGWERRRRVNGEFANVWGMEIAWQQNLTFLPGPLSRLSIYSNYTYTKSVAEFEADDEVTPMEDQTPHTVNLAFEYNYRGFSGMISTHYRSETFESYQQRSIGDYDWHRYDMASWDIDLQANQHIHSGINVYAQVNNLLNRNIEEHIRHPRAGELDAPSEADRTWPDGYTNVGWNAQLGVRARF